MVKTAPVTPDVKLASRNNPIVVYVPVDLVSINNKSLREVDVANEMFVEQVLKPILREGLNTPVTLIEDSATGVHPELGIIQDGPLAGELTIYSPAELLDGRHRFKVYEMIAKEEVDTEWFGEGKDAEDFKYIRAEYWGKVDEYDRLRLQVQFNKSRVDTTPIEISSQCAKMFLLRPGLKHDDLAADLGIHRSQLSNVLNLNRLPLDVRNFIKEHDLTSANQYEMGRLHKHGELVDWEDLCAKSEDLTVGEFKDHCKGLRETLKKPSKNPNVYESPGPKARGADELIGLFNNESEFNALGLDTAHEFLLYVVKQDADYLKAHKENWQDKQQARRDKKMISYIRTAAGAYIKTDKEDSVDDIMLKLETCDHEDGPAVFKALTTWIGRFRAGEVDIPGQTDTKKKAEKKAPKPRRKRKTAK